MIYIGLFYMDCGVSKWKRFEKEKDEKDERINHTNIYLRRYVLYKYISVFSCPDVSILYKHKNILTKRNVNVKTILESTILLNIKVLFLY